MDTTSLRLKILREEKELTLEQVGDICGVNKSTVLRWEQGNGGKMSKSALKVLADYYNVNPLWICGLSEDRTAKGMVVDALEEDILLMFRKLDNRQKIALYNSIKIMCEAFERTSENG